MLSHNFEGREECIVGQDVLKVQIKVQQTAKLYHHRIAL